VKVRPQLARVKRSWLDWLRLKGGLEVDLKPLFFLAETRHLVSRPFVQALNAALDVPEK